MRVIMGNDYTTYKDGLKDLKLETLEKRREFVCLKFATFFIKSEKVQDLFQPHTSKHK